jgi:hypothetical protein
MFRPACAMAPFRPRVQSNARARQSARRTRIDAEISRFYRIVTSITLAVLATDYRHSFRSVSEPGWTFKQGEGT